MIAEDIETGEGREYIVLDENGDVILVLEYAEIKVSSTVLANTSSVFKAMFGSGFSEEAQLSTSSPGLVTLPDDDSIAMIGLCEAAHHRLRSISSNSSPKQLFQMTKLADKYDCQHILWLPVKLFFTLWGKHHSPSGQDCEYLLYVLLKFPLKKEINEILGLIISHSQLPLTPLPDELVQCLPKAWPRSLCEIVTRAKLVVAAKLTTILKNECNIHCRYHSRLQIRVEPAVDWFNGALATKSIAESINGYALSYEHCKACVSELRCAIWKDVRDQVIPKICWICADEDISLRTRAMGCPHDLTG